MMSKRFLNSASIQPPLDVRRRKIQATFRLMMDDIFGYFRVLLLPSHKCTFHGLHIRNWAFFGPTTAALHHNHKHRRFDEVGRGGAERSGACHATPPRYPQMYAHISRRRSLPPSMRSHSPLPLSLSLSPGMARALAAPVGRGLLGIQIITWFVQAGQERAWKERGAYFRKPWKNVTPLNSSYWRTGHTHRQRTEILSTNISTLLTVNSCEV